MALCLQCLTPIQKAPDGSGLRKLPCSNPKCEAAGSFGGLPTIIVSVDVGGGRFRPVQFRRVVATSVYHDAEEGPWELSHHFWQMAS